MSSGEHLPVVAAALAEIGLRQCGRARILQSAPAGSRRSLLKVAVAGRDARSVVVKLVPLCQDVEARVLRWEHQVTRGLYAVAAAEGLQGAIPEVLHQEPVEVGNCLVSVRDYVEPTGAMTPRVWGHLIATLHRLGATSAARALPGSRPADPLLGLDVEHLFSRLRSTRHPFGADPLLGEVLAQELRRRVAHALEDGDARQGKETPLLVHRDLHPSNMVAGPAGPVAIDWAEAGWGARGEDFAWLHVAVTRFATPVSVLDDVLAGYDDVSPGSCPDAEEIRAWGQVRELMCLAYSIQNAGLSAQHLREARVELAVLSDPDAVTPTWLPLFNPAAFTHPMLRRGARRWGS